jgi:hypothetical protein
VDAQGKRTQVYKEAGQVRPIDASVRAWIEKVSQPPAIVPEPQFPRVEDMAEFKALIAQIGTHPDVAAKLGAPVVMTAKPLDGTIRLDDSEGEGEADIRIELSGPKGRATVAAEAIMSGRKWTLRRVAAE